MKILTYYCEENVNTIIFSDKEYHKTGAVLLSIITPCIYLKIKKKIKKKKNLVPRYNAHNVHMSKRMHSTSCISLFQH